MSASYQVVALNSSPHENIGNTSRMLAMLREHLEHEGFTFEEIFLNQHHLEYCTGCGLCLEKGSCWIRDDHKNIAQRVFAADGAPIEAYKLKTSSVEAATRLQQAINDIKGIYGFSDAEVEAFKTNY